ncbi:HupF/HypC family protein [mine drainage metagenome]|jgi:hydrogenase expression/formation protein HypC|uniref:HupF/HypC family protein n=1 Tax=mine drainage metagenome TaxID=410659 RepID=A0A1J5RKM4_9ZZZZ
MCLGIPMQVIEVHETYALCEGRNGRQVINTMLVDRVEVGQWLMTFLDAGREVIDAERAALVNAALDGLQAVSEGGEVDLDVFFADLVNREPTLPEFLRKDKV